MGKISPRVDIAFKKIFGVEENKDLLISLINSIVSHEDQVKDVTLLNPYNAKTFKNDKLSILDIKATSEEGRRFNIEIQISDEADYDKRALYYWAKLYTEQLKVAEDYASLSKAIGIHILNFTSIPESPNYHNVFHILEKNSGFSYFKDLELHTIELKKFSKNSQEDLKDILGKIKSSLDIWVAFLTRNDLINREHLPKELDNPALKKALNVLDVMNFGEEELQFYEDHLKWLRIEANTLKKYENQGHEKGIIEGHKKGKAEGLIEGIEKGKVEGKLETAKMMKNANVSISDIIKFTGLTKEDIEIL
ncbi:MAG: hypothetical protein HEEMFOPI_01159 [Holosporales bacterium]